MTFVDGLKLTLTRRRIRPKLCFMHVPKAAGTAVIKRIEFNLRPRRSEYRLDGTQFGSFDRFDTMSKSVRDGILFDVRRIPKDTDVLMGHMGLKTFERCFPDARKATIVREPTVRLVSQWLYNRTYDDTRAALYGDWGRMFVLSRLPLRDFVCQNDIFCLIDNTLTRMLLWPHPLIPENAAIESTHDDFLYREAAAALDRFDYIDSAENENLIDNFSNWLDFNYGRSIVSRVKTLMGDRDSGAVKNGFSPSNYKKSFDIEVEIAEAAALLHVRTRIDRKLWDNVISNRLRKSVEVFSRRAWESALSRYRISERP